MSGALKVGAHQLHNVQKHPLMGARLTFYIKEGMLIGHAGGKQVHLHAFSGGGGGSKRGIFDKNVVNNPAKVGLKTSEHHKNPKLDHHGGPIPPGDYTIKTPDGSHPHLGKLSAELVPSGHNHMFGRGGFFIHGRGPHGSDGCIVPATSHDFQTLMHLLHADHGGHLRVIGSSRPR